MTSRLSASDKKRARNLNVLSNESLLRSGETNNGQTEGVSLTNENFNLTTKSATNFKSNNMAQSGRRPNTESSKFNLKSPKFDYAV